MEMEDVPTSPLQLQLQLQLLVLSDEWNKGREWKRIESFGGSFGPFKDGIFEEAQVSNQIYQSKWKKGKASWGGSEVGSFLGDTFL